MAAFCMSETGVDSAVLLKTQHLGRVLTLTVQTHDTTTPQKSTNARTAPSPRAYVFQGQGHSQQRLIKRIQHPLPPRVHAVVKAEQVVGDKGKAQAARRVGEGH